MEELLLKKLLDGGYVLPVILWFLWDKGHAFYRRKSGKWISYESIAADIEEMDTKLKGLETKVNEHLIKGAEEDIVIATMKNEQEHFKEEVKEFKDNQKQIFQMISDIKNMLIKQSKN